MTTNNKSFVSFRLEPDLKAQFKLAIKRSQYRSAQHWFEAQVKKEAKTILPRTTKRSKP